MINTGKVVRVGGLNLSTLSAQMLGTQQKGIASTIRRIFANGEQGFFYDPNDLTAEKINWRKNLLLNTEDFTYGSSGKYSAVKEADGWALTAISQDSTGYFLLGVQYPIGAASDSRGAGTVVRSIEVKKGTGVFRFGSIVTGTSLFVDVATMTALGPPSSITYTITAVGSDWYRLETFNYAGSFSSIALSNYIGWSTAKTVSTLDTTNQVGTVIRVRNPSFAFVPYESTQSIPYQPITDFNSDFIKRFPLHTLYQDVAATVPVTAAGQPVGLMLDKSKGVTLGSELNTNDFSTDLNGWVAGASVIAVIDNAEARITFNGERNGGTSNWFRLTSPTERGRLYTISFDATHVSGGDLQADIVWTSGKTVLASQNAGVKQRYSFTVFRAISENMLATFGASTAGSVWKIGNVSVKEVLGNHAYQSTSAARPILQQIPILGSELIQDTGFNDPAYWTTESEVNVSGGFVNFVDAPTGQNIRIANILTLGKTYQLTLTTTSRTSGGIRPEISSGTGRVLLTNFSGRTGTFTVTAVASGTTPDIRLTAVGMTNATVDSISVKEIVGYRTDQKYLEFDGIDDKLITNLPAPLTNATVLRAIPNVGTEVKHNQTIPMLYEDSTNHAGLIAIDRALTRQEQLRLLTGLDKKAGATGLYMATFNMFDNNQEGLFYDPNDLSTMYQDAEGTVPVTAPEQPVGLILDKSGCNTHAYQTSSSSRPILRKNTETGANYLAFDGVDDFMVTEPLKLEGKKELTIHAGFLALPSSLVYEFLLANASSISDPGLIRIRTGALNNQTFDINTVNYVYVSGPSGANRPENRVMCAKFSSNVPHLSFTVNGVTTEKVTPSVKDTTLSTLPMYIGRQSTNSWNAAMNLYGLTIVSAITSEDFDRKTKLDYANKMGN